MKKILVFVFITLSTLSFSQNKAEIKEFFWGKSDQYSKANSVPDKWKGESAVVIYKNEYYNFHKFGKSVTYSSAIRKRIKLLDQAAVTEFSEFSFNERFQTNKGYSWKSGSTSIGVKVIKPSGKEIDIDVDKDAKKIDAEKKIAIPNLEIGDIIDFYYYSINYKF